jgi:hypothetical protein
MWLASWFGKPTLAPHRHHAQLRRRTTRTFQVEQLEHRWCPSCSLVSSRAALAGTDSLDWAKLGAPGTSVANPFTVSSTAGRSVTVNKTESGTFLLDEQWGPTTPNSYVIHGNFAPGDIVLATNGAPHTGRQNTITLNFGATPVAAGGAQIMTNRYGRFTAEIDALDSQGKTLARFTEAGNATNAADNSAIFLGISSTSPTIYQIAISVTQAAYDQYKGVFAINKFDFRTSPLAAATSAAVPAIGQPASALDLAPLASSLPGTGPDAPPAVPAPRPATPSTSPAGPSGSPTASDVSSPVPAGATDAVFAASHPPTNDDGAWLFAPLSSGSLDAQ